MRRVDTTGMITTVAGTGVDAYGGDGSAAIDAQIESPEELAFDATGNLYIADVDNNRVRRVDTNGIITTVAGNGTRGTSGDMGSATDAELDNPECIAIDGSGNLFLGDFSQRIRKVDTNGIITTTVGLGGDPGGDGGLASVASIGAPFGAAFDGSGNFYFADDTERVRRVDTAGVITTGREEGDVDPAGIGPIAQAQLADPRAFAIGASFTLFAGGTSGVVEALTTTALAAPRGGRGAAIRTTSRTVCSPGFAVPTSAPSAASRSMRPPASSI